MTPTARQRLVAALAHRGLAPCGDSSCLLAPPSGMATNGGCRCAISRHGNTQDTFDARRAARALAAVVRDLHAVLEQQRAALQRIVDIDAGEEYPIIHSEIAAHALGIWPFQSSEHVP